MHIRNVLLLIYVLPGVFACNDSSTGKQIGTNNSKDSTSVQSSVKSGLDAASILKQADSLQIMYYDDPDGDPVRYSRFYRYVATKDALTVNDLLANLSQPVQKHSEIKNCRSEGKIYVFDRRQEPVKTIYFSTRCDTCCYIYFIEQGTFYYCSLSDNFKNRLQEAKKNIRKP